MGATGWNHFVPYKADVAGALQRLREDVFARDDYVYGDGVTDEERKAVLERMQPDLGSWMQKMNERAATLQEPLKTQYLEMAEQIKAEVSGSSSPSRKPKRKPKTIEALLEIQAGSGTHSILDIVTISAEPRFGAISPFPRSKLVEFFGSETPSHAEIEEVYDSGSLEEFVSERWQGVYFVVYRDGSPSEIFFAGCSGD